MADYVEQVIADNRFAFGRNWENFLRSVDEVRVAEAEKSLLQMLSRESLKGLTFLDIGSGSGLFSLAARRLGAEVYSFDFDPLSVSCTRRLKEEYFPNDANWTVREGSILDASFVLGLGTFDIVYSWGVLHHTNNMWRAFEHLLSLSHPGTQLYIAIYNDQGYLSRFWLTVKKAYCSSRTLKMLICTIFIPFFTLRAALVSVIRHRNLTQVFREYKTKRGMSALIDCIDWLGGYPFEVAKPEEVHEYFFQRGFCLNKLTTTNRNGCNEFVFVKSDKALA